jgi:hypothetical protein
MILDAPDAVAQAIDVSFLDFHGEFFGRILEHWVVFNAETSGNRGKFESQMTQIGAGGCKR